MSSLASPPASGRKTSGRSRGRAAGRSDAVSDAVVFTILVVSNMPRFFFDLFLDRVVVLDPGGMPFEFAAGAVAAADKIARHLLASRPELRRDGSWIRVRDERGKEVYRSTIDPQSAACDAAVVEARATGRGSGDRDATGDR
jgi:hypothetical protein